MSRILISPVREQDRSLVKNIFDTCWASTVIVTRGRVCDGADLPGFLAELDGELAGQTYETSDVDYTLSNPVVIGADEDPGDVKLYFWQGLIDEVKIYGYALTPEQVRNEYNGGAVSFR